MNQNLLSLSHEPFAWQNVLPVPFKGVRLPGSTIASAIGEFGSLCIQEYRSDNYSIRFSVFDILQRFICKSITNETGLHGRLMIKGKADHETENAVTFSLNKNQFALLSAEKIEITTVYNKDLHISFDTYISNNIIENFNTLFPSLPLTDPGSPKLISAPQWADSETFDLAQSILRCKYENNLRRYFFESRVRDLFFKYILRATEPSLPEKEPTEKELQAINNAEQIIISNISLHHPIPDLAKKVLLNEFRFKQVFKKIFGSGPYEYLIRKRLTRSKELLESGLSVKETAAQVGYRPSDFTTAFRNHFGFAPSSIKKKNN